MRAIELKSIKNDLLILSAVTLLACISYAQHVSVPHYHSISKIEDGEVIVRNDSITTVVIP